MGPFQSLSGEGFGFSRSVHCKHPRAGTRASCQSRIADLLHHDGESSVRCAAADYFGQLLPALRPKSAKGAIDALTTALQDRCPHVCARAMYALRTVPQGETQSVLELVAPTALLLGNGDKFVRARARAVLGSFSALSESHIAGFLTERCETMDGEDRLRAQRALANLGSESTLRSLEFAPRRSWPSSSWDCKAEAYGAKRRRA
ncbi:unnamed protein product [Symbiodinium microadriaticum]|nr:unnamed protein product [Symbiodinium microadriaticum]